MSSSEKELAEQLVAAGKKLAEPPESVDELLALLEQVESCLVKIEQAPPVLIQDALPGPLKALVADQLLKHSNVDVRVGVASCISEITRITAPEAPYEDDQMKVVFQLIVSSFENLSENASRSYNRRKSILETVAKVRSCVVMLDLECDALIVEMFQHFLKTLRDHHPDVVFSNMETIMTLVLEESEEIPSELLFPLLAGIKKDNEEILPIARKLAERVLEKCANKLKPYLLQAVKSLGHSVDDYSKVVALICEDASGAVHNSKIPAASEQPVSLEKGTEVTSPEQADPATEKSLKSNGSNGVPLTGDSNSLVDSSSLKKQVQGHIDVTETVSAWSKTQPESPETEKVEIAECNPEIITDKGEKKPGSLVNSETYNDATADDEKDSEKPPDDEKSPRKEVPNPSVEALSAQEALPSENKKEGGSQISSPKKHESATVENLADESHPTKQRTNKEGLTEAATSADTESKKLSEARSSGKNVHVAASDDDKGSASVDAANKDTDKSAAEVKSKKSEKKGDVTKSVENENRKKRGRKRAAVGMDLTKSAAKDGKKPMTKDDDMETFSSPNLSKKTTNDEVKQSKTSQKQLKRKRTIMASDIKQYGQNLVGSKIKVWWPEDKEFYEGVVESFDPEKKKHKVAYDDGDVEILNLKREKWEFVKSNLESDEEEAVDPSSPDAPSESPLKKKAKTNSGTSAKQAKADASLKKVGRGSSKSKSVATKSGSQSGEASGAGGKRKDKSVNKSLEDDGRRLKECKDGSQAADSTSKIPSKSKVDDPKSTPKSKGKLSKCSTKSDTNGGNGSNSGSKMEEIVEPKENSTDSKKAPGGVKLKSPASSGRKRRRGAKN